MIYLLHSNYRDFINNYCVQTKQTRTLKPEIASERGLFLWFTFNESDPNAAYLS